MTPQSWATYLAPAVRPLYELVAARVGRELGVKVTLHDPRDYAQLARNEHDFAFVCGLPYVEIVDGLISMLEPVAAPVLSGFRYGGRPVYFSDVIVPARRDAASFADLRGGRWAFNEVGSHSGYLLTLHRLATMGENTGFFTEWVDAGFHEEAIRMVAEGVVDGSAIDSQVLAVALDRDPSLHARLRVVESLGPSTIQPLVAGPQVLEDVRERVAQAVVSLGTLEEERAVMRTAKVDHFVAVDDSDYDGIRRMLTTVRMAGLWTGAPPARRGGPGGRAARGRPPPRSRVAPVGKKISSSTPASSNLAASPLRASGLSEVLAANCFSSPTREFVVFLHEQSALEEGEPHLALRVVTVEVDEDDALPGPQLQLSRGDRDGDGR